MQKDADGDPDYDLKNYPIDKIPEVEDESLPDWVPSSDSEPEPEVVEPAEPAAEPVEEPEETGVATGVIG